jgi:prepilin-type N-terminal cleavage/methylation domain-containing protein
MAGRKEAGFTLTEVMAALLITGIILAVSLRFFTEQWRSNQALKDKLEVHYAVMNAGRMVLDAIREAESVQWANTTKMLAISPGDEDSYTDQYYIADKDYDGVKDLYRLHKGAHNPVVSGLIDWNCVKGETGLWTITIRGKVGDQNLEWQGSIRQRASQVLNLVLLPS